MLEELVLAGVGLVEAFGEEEGVLVELLVEGVVDLVVV